MQDLKLKCGHTVKAKRWGNTIEGPQILFLHGIQSHSMWFDPIATYLQTLGCESWAYDRKGFGGSDGEIGHIENVEFALEELESVIENITTLDRSIHIVGMSWGGALAAYFALKNPEFDASISLGAFVGKRQRC